MNMISYDDIRQLQQYPSSPDTSVLSLYLDVDQSNAANLNRGFLTAVENLFRRMADSNGGNNKHAFETECRRVLDFLRDYTPRGKGLVLFSDSRNELWWQRDLKTPLPTEARWSPSPWVRPLLEVIEEHDRFAVVLIDNHRAKVFVGDAAGLELISEIESDVPNRHMTTGTDHIWSQSRMDRDRENHIRTHARRVADELNSAVERRKLMRVIISGPVEATSIFESELPRRIQQMIVETISLPFDAAPDKLLAEVGKVLERAEEEDETRLVESLITAAMKGDRAVLGINDTLEAINEGRVMRMVVAKGYRAGGSQCRSCNVLVAEDAERCPYCGGEFAPAPDLVNRASHKVLEQSGRVQIVSGTAAEKLNSAGIGAMLRF
jgi:peptide chain release factor subunit 1